MQNMKHATTDNQWRKCPEGRYTFRMRAALRVVIEVARRGWRRRGGLRWWERHAPGVIEREVGEEVLGYVDGTGGRDSALMWLGLMFEEEPPAELSFDAWFSGTRAALLDGLADELRGRWATAKRGGAVVDAFMDAAERAGRRELAVWVLGRAPLARVRVARWVDEARAVRFFEDEYAAAQRLLAAVEA